MMEEWKNGIVECWNIGEKADRKEEVHKMPKVRYAQRRRLRRVKCLKLMKTRKQ
jgi:hypothetical protein